MRTSSRSAVARALALYLAEGHLGARLERALASGVVVVPMRHDDSFDELEQVILELDGEGVVVAIQKEDGHFDFVHVAITAATPQGASNAFEVSTKTSMGMISDSVTMMTGPMLTKHRAGARARVLTHVG